MNERQLWGVYAPYINDFIALKRGLGFKYHTEATILSIFDRFTIQRGERKVGITRELADEWCKKSENVTGNDECSKNGNGSAVKMASSIQ